MAEEKINLDDPGDNPDESQALRFAIGEENIADSTSTDDSNPPDDTDDTLDLDASDDDDGDDDDGTDVTDDTDWKARHGDATRALQKESADRKALQARLQKFTDAGIDLAEIEGLIDTTQGGNNKPFMTAPNDGTNRGNSDFVTKKALQGFAQGITYQMERNTFIAKNPAFSDPDMGEMLDLQARAVVNAEVKQHGRPQSNPTQILAKAAKKINTLVGKAEVKGKVKATEKRTKIDEQAIPEGGKSDSGGKSKSSDDDTPFNAKSSFVNLQRETQRKIKNPRL